MKSIVTPDSDAAQAIKATLSTPRIETYEAATAGDPNLSRALALYAWNAQVSAAMLAPLHICEVSIRKEVPSDVGETIPNPSHHSVVFGGMYVRHEAVKAFVTLWRPFGDEASQVVGSTQQIKPRQSCSVQYFHEDLGSNGL
jgi:hypothetical protein